MSWVDWGAVLTGVVTASIIGAVGAFWVLFSNYGRSVWRALGEEKGVRPVAVISFTALSLAIVALIAIALRQEEYELNVVSGERVYAIKNSNNPDWRAEGGKCPDNWTLVGYYCQIGDEELPNAGTGNLQNLGVTGGAFQCLWNNVTDHNFRAWGAPLCLRISKK